MTLNTPMTELHVAVQNYTNTLLQQHYPDQSSMISAIGCCTEDECIFTYITEPRVKLVASAVMGGGDEYCFEMKCGSLVVGFTLITNYDRIRTQTESDDLTNVFLEIVPVYVIRDCVVEFWSWYPLSDSKVELIAKGFRDMTNQLIDDAKGDVTDE